MAAARMAATTSSSSRLFLHYSNKETVKPFQELVTCTVSVCDSLYVVYILQKNYHSVRSFVRSLTVDTPSYTEYLHMLS